MRCTVLDFLLLGLFMEKEIKDKVEKILQKYGHCCYLITDKRIYVKGETDIVMAYEIRKIEKRTKSVKSVWSNSIYFKQGYRTFIDLEN